MSPGGIEEIKLKELHMRLNILLNRHRKKKDEAKVKMWNESQTAPENGVFDR